MWLLFRLFSEVRQTLSGSLKGFDGNQMENSTSCGVQLIAPNPYWELKQENGTISYTLHLGCFYINWPQHIVKQNNRKPFSD